MDWSENFFILLIHYCIETFREYMFLRILFISHMLDVHVDQPIKWWMEENIFSFLNVFLAPGEENIQTSEYTNFIFSGSDNCSRGILCIDFRGASDRNSCSWYVHNEITSQRLKKLQRHFKLGTVHEFKAVLR